MRCIKLLLFSIGAALLVACAALPEEPTVSVTPFMTPEIEMARHDARLCSSPVVAIEKPDRNFKYGCFCGAGYPGLTHPSGKMEKDLTESEKQELIVAYYSIEPSDAIDTACQAHDICWLMHGQPETACNIAFDKTLRSLAKSWNASRSWYEVDRFEFRCEQLARDLGFATSTVMEGGTTSGASTFQAVVWPLTVTYVAITAVDGFVGGSYPRANERCIDTR